MQRSKNIKTVTIALVVVITLLLSLPRFAHHTPDSKHYVNLASFFRGELAYDALKAPYVYRVLAPFLAAWGPVEDISINFAVLNTIFITGAYLIFYLFLEELLAEEINATIGIALTVISFPTINYVSGVLTDPIALFFFIAALYALFHDRMALFCALSSTSILVRESNLALVLILFCYLLLKKRFLPQKPNNNLSFLYGIPPVIVFWLIRMCFFEIPAYPMVPSMSTLVRNLTEPIIWATSLLTIFPLLGIILVALFTRKREYLLALSKIPLEQKTLGAAIAVGGCAMACFAMLTAYMSGRFLWPLYVVMIPLAAIGCRFIFTGKRFNSLLAKD